MSAVLRVFAKGQLGERVAAFPASEVDCAWREGEWDRVRRKVLDTSGFNLTLSDAEKAEDMVAEATVALERVVPQIAEFLQEGATAVLDFAISLTERWWSRSITLDLPMLRLAQQHGIQIKVTAYAVSDAGDD